MATECEGNLLKKYGPYTGKTIVETGSHHEFSTKLRRDSPGATYIGVDMRDGKNVDVVHNLNTPLSLTADVVLCFSILEHCDKPWLVAQHIEQMLVPDGLLLLTVPFAWRYHPHPDDYFRFTFSGIKILFPSITWMYEDTDPPNNNLSDHPKNKVILIMAGRKQ